MNPIRILVFALPFTLLTLNPRGNVPQSAIPQTAGLAKATAEKPPTQLADEVIRRLRRLGLNFVKTRIPHPYDPLDNLC